MPDGGPRLRIVHTNNALEWNGTGHTNSTVELALEHAALGHTVTMVCGRTDSRMRNLLEANGLSVVDGVDGSSFVGLWRSARRLAPLLRRQDVVHVHTLRTAVLAALSAPWMFLRRSVSTLHNPHQRSAWLMCATTRVVTLNGTDRDTVRRMTLGLRVPTVINNGLVGSRRLPALADVVPVALPENSIVFVGALHARKGVDVLLRSMVGVRKRVSDARLVIVGNRDNPAMERLAVDLGVADITCFAGFSDDPRRYMKAAAAFVLPSRTEGFGNVLVEARTCGVPIIASQIGGIPEALAGGAGRLVPPGDEAALTEALVDVLQDPCEAARLVDAAREGLEDFSVRRAAGEYTAVFRSVTRPKRSKATAPTHSSTARSDPAAVHPEPGLAVLPEPRKEKAPSPERGADSSPEAPAS